MIRGTFIGSLCALIPVPSAKHARQVLPLWASASGLRVKASPQSSTCATDRAHVRELIAGVLSYFNCGKRKPTCGPLLDTARDAFKILFGCQR